MSLQLDRRTGIVAAVLILHGGALWALQSGLLRRALEVVVPVSVLSEMIEPPRPLVEPPPPPPKPLPRAQGPKPAPTPAPQPLPPPPMPVALADPAPAPPNAPTGVVAPPVAPLPPIAAPVAPAAAPVVAAAPPPAPPPPPRVEWPSSDADYLQNPKPSYPAISRRLGEQGRVVVRVLIGIDGSAQKAEIATSSGFDRLDQAALSTVQRWRYVPGKRGGVPEAMWFNVPLQFVLD